jgi:hypothetical protein
MDQEMKIFFGKRMNQRCRLRVVENRCHRLIGGFRQDVTAGVGQLSDPNRVAQGGGSVLGHGMINPSGEQV